MMRGILVAACAIAVTIVGWTVTRPKILDVRVTSEPFTSAVGKELETAYGPQKYSMGPEEWILRELLKDKTRGVFVDVGAADARILSNTYFWEAQRGWSGLAVEPQTSFAPDYATYRPKTTFKPVFISDHAEPALPFYIATDAREGASADPNWGKGAPTTAVTVPTVTLDALLTQEGITAFDLLSMDIEGHEPQALAGFSIETFRPAVVVIEAHGSTRQAILDYFTQHRYVLQGRYLQADPLNFYFVPLP